MGKELGWGIREASSIVRNFCWRAFCFFFWGGQQGRRGGEGATVQSALHLWSVSRGVKLFRKNILSSSLPLIIWPCSFLPLAAWLGLLVFFLGSKKTKWARLCGQEEGWWQSILLPLPSWLHLPVFLLGSKKTQQVRPCEQGEAWRQSVLPIQPFSPYLTGERW